MKIWNLLFDDETLLFCDTNSDWMLYLWAIMLYLMQSELILIRTVENVNELLVKT